MNRGIIGQPWPLPADDPESRVKKPPIEVRQSKSAPPEQNSLPFKAFSVALEPVSKGLLLPRHRQAQAIVCMNIQ
jgi:hypothetical protein